MSYDYTFKILMLGDETVGKTSLTLRYISGLYLEDLRLTIGTDFYSKSTIFNGKKIKLQIWDFGGEERFRFLLSQYCKGANAAFFLYDITNRNTLTHLADWTQIMREHAGNIPIMLVGTKAHLEEFRAVTRKQGIQRAKEQKLSGFVEVSSKTGQNVDKLFEVMTEIIFEQIHSIKRISNPEIVLIDTICPEFKVNEYITLRLEHDHTIVNIAGKAFYQCKQILLDLPLDETKDYDRSRLMGKAIEILHGTRMKTKREKLTPGFEFWAHCCNIQAWVKSDYDTRILDRKLAFPLLKALYYAGDPKARRVFKEEIAMRFESGYPNVILYLINQGYLRYLNEEELASILTSQKFLKNVPESILDKIPRNLALKIKQELSQFQETH
ncbi:MAG: Rab family GTPase [Candidatus Hodarchaeota archaeon]